MTNRWVERFSFLSSVEPDVSNPVDWKRARGDDIFCAELIAYLASKQKKSAILIPKFADVIRRTAHEYVVNNGVLHRFVVMNNGRLCRKVKTVRLVVVPVFLQEQVLSEVHDSPMGGGHLGQRATYAKLQARYYWSTMAKDLIDYLKRCRVCAQFNKGPRKPQTLLHKMEPPYRPWEMVAMDVVTCSQTASGNCKMLVVVDHFTLWAEAFPMADERAETIARNYVRGVNCRHGVPRRVLTDQRTNFMSKVVASLHKLLGTKRLRTTAYHPSDNGLNERVNGTIKGILGK